ncbi:MAG: glycine--tRNA ligase subunit beta [Xanthomonadales bacterium]|nr:glycine--tRNA ligase subunit beta [Xanthomonadales bacterium]
MAEATRADLLIELGCEELPPLALPGLAEAFASGLVQRLADAGLVAADTEPDILYTPRRIAARVPGVAAGQPDQRLERRGPSLDVAYDDDGQPTQAALGFARSVGMEVGELQTLETDKGRWLYCEVEQPGEPLAALLFPLLDETLARLPVPRPMRWSDHAYSFVRPLQWLLVLHGDAVLEGQVLGQHAGRRTRGHRVHSPGPHDVPDSGAYEAVLEQAKVLADPQRRRERIAQQVAEAARQAGGVARVRDALLDEVNCLVEWPSAIAGEYDPAFLDVPPEALVASMEDHQKFFPVYADGQDGALLPAFVGVANVDSSDPAQVRKGYERVIRPRLADARFFWEQDLAMPLDDQVQALDAIVYQEKLGSLGDKTRRIEALSKEISELIDADPAPAQRAATLSRADLVTRMVGEFPELQGVMGRYYAAAAGEPDEVAAAIEGYYRPRFAGDDIPANEAGRVVGLADRLDTLVGIFAAGQKPSGNKDPFGLRRAALGVVRILLEAGVNVPLDVMIARAAAQFEGRVELDKDTRLEVRDFVVERARQYFREQGHSTSSVNAALAAPLGSLPDLAARLDALKTFMQDPAAEDLVAANKRIGNILRKSEEQVSGEIDADQLSSEHEKSLFKELSSTQKTLAPLMRAHDYPAVLQALANLRAPVNAFFDHVMVMDEDPAVRRNRLALLARLKAQFDQVADFAQASG